jgi:hypothetical protein
MLLSSTLKTWKQMVSIVLLLFVIIVIVITEKNLLASSCYEDKYFHFFCLTPIYSSMPCFILLW